MVKTQDRLTEKQSAFCKWLFTPGSEVFGNGTESARKAGYAGNDNVLAVTANRLLRNDKIIAERVIIQAETVKKLDLSRNAQYQRLLKIHDNISTMGSTQVSCIREMNEMLGYHRDKAPNTERQEQIRSRMDQEEQIYREEFTLTRTRALSRSVGLVGSKLLESKTIEKKEKETPLQQGGGASELKADDNKKNLPNTQIFIPFGDNKRHGE